MKKNNGCDTLLLFTILVLTGLGVIMVFSSSAVVGQQLFQSSTIFLERQVEWVVIGIICMVLFYNLDYSKLKFLIIPWMLISFVPMFLLSFHVIGNPVRGANRWVRMWGFSYQPSEFAKIGFIIYLAYILEKKQPVIDNFSESFLPPIIFSFLCAVVVYFQPDTGAAVLFISIAFIMCFIAGVPKKYLLGTFFAIVVPIGVMLICSSSYRMKRIKVFLNPENYTQGAGFQATQSLFALGSGGMTGLGLGKSRQKLFFLPEAHTDFVFSIIGEELGFLGSSLVIFLFFIVIWRGFRIAGYCRDSFGILIASGVSSLLALNFVINIGVTTSMLPTKGLALPFLSFGGSSLISNMIGMGILLNISEKR